MADFYAARSATITPLPRQTFAPPFPAFLFHHPATGLDFAGTVNQANGWGHASAVRAILRIIKTVRA